MRRLSLFLIIVVILSLTGCSRPVNSDNTVPSVATTRVAKGQILGNDIIAGKIEAIQAASVVSKVTGKIDLINVDIGSQVKRGDILFGLEAGDLATDIEIAQATVDKSQVAYDLASKNYERGKELVASSAISQAEFDNSIEGNFKKAETDLRLARAQLEKSRIKYADMFVKAPFDGLVTARNINPGELANPQIAAIVMVNLNKVAIKTSASDQQINKLHPGQDIKVKISALPSQSFTGKITNVSLAPDPASKSYPVKIQIDNPGQMLKPGMFGEAYLQDEQEGLLIPLTALLGDKNERYVFVAEDGKCRKQSVTTGLADKEHIIITSGLQEGNMIIISGLNQLKDGQQVVTK